MNNWAKAKKLREAENNLRVLRFFKTNSGATHRQAAMVVNLNPEVVGRHVKKLKERGDL